MIIQEFHRFQFQVSTAIDVVRECQCDVRIWFIQEGTVGTPFLSTKGREGAHKGCPYQLFSLGVMAWGGHPQGARNQLSFLGVLAGENGAHKGCPLPIVFSRRYALG